MTREEAFITTINVYQEYYRQVTSRRDYVFELDNLGRKEKVLNRFLNHLDNKYDLKFIGLEFIVNFIESGFNLYYDATHLKFGTSSIQIEWIIGNKAIERYERIKDKDNKYFRKNRKIRRDFSLRIIDKFKAAKVENVKAINDILTSGEIDYYEQEKSRFYNTSEGLAWCMANTTLFNHKSGLCNTCDNRTRCKGILEQNYPKLYSIRGYGN